MSQRNDSASQTKPKSTIHKPGRFYKVHRYLGNKHKTKPSRISEHSKTYLARIAHDERYRYRSSAKMRLQHLRSALEILEPGAFARYVHLFGVDEPMQALLDQLDPVEEPVKKKKTKAQMLRLVKKLSEDKKFKYLRNLAWKMSDASKEERDTFNDWALTLLDDVWRPEFQRVINQHPFGDPKKKQLELMNRPLTKVPFSTKERKYVEGLLSLLMRTSESVARRPWPQKELCSFDDPHARPDDEAKANQVRKIRQGMEKDEHCLDELRKRIEHAWPDHNKDLGVHRLSITDLIDRVRALDEEVVGIPLLPSTACIKYIIKIVNKAYPLEVRSPADKRCAMPSDLKKEFRARLRRMSLYDNWRATNPPDSECFSDYVPKNS